MKIIAKVSEGRFLAEVGEEEVGRIAGRAIYNRYGNQEGLVVVVGTEIGVNAIYDRLVELKRIEERTREAQRTLRALADLLEPLSGVVKGAFENKLEEPK